LQIEKIIAIVKEARFLAGDREKEGILWKMFNSQYFGEVF
jgi:hypothetical protein